MLSSMPTVSASISAERRDRGTRPLAGEPVILKHATPVDSPRSGRVAFIDATRGAAMFFVFLAHFGYVVYGSADPKLAAGSPAK